MKIINILLVLFVICFCFFALGKMKVNTASVIGTVIDCPITLEETNVI